MQPPFLAAHFLFFHRCNISGWLTCFLDWWDERSAMNVAGLIKLLMEVVIRLDWTRLRPKLDLIPPSR